MNGTLISNTSSRKKQFQSRFSGKEEDTNPEWIGELLLYLALFFA
jgi:hypothetical protein